MATLQKIRSKGPLLVGAVGLALFAFIAGDAWRVLQPHQSQDVGEVGGESLSARDYQAMVEEYTEVVKYSSGLTALTDEQANRLQDDVWRTYVENKLIEAEAEKFGLKVTNDELQSIIDAGTHPLLRQTPFSNPQTGTFDADALKKFLVDYSNMNRAQMPAQLVENYDEMYRYWAFIERTLKQMRLQEKYQALITKSLLSNPVEAQHTFDARVNQTDVLLTAVPYSSIPDTTVSVSDSDLQAAYNKKKEQFKQPVEVRNIRYIDVQVTASEEDKAALRAEMDEYTAQLSKTTGDYASFIRSTGSDYPYVDLYCSTRALPGDVVSRLDSVAVGDVFGPYYNVTDNTLNSFKRLGEAMLPDSIEYRQIQVMASDLSKTRTLADSIYNALKGGADFTALAEKYNQKGDKVWLASAAYEGAQLDGDNLKYVQTLNNLKTNEIENVSLGQFNIVVQVTNRKAMTEKHKVAVIKRPIEFSKETYSKAYNQFSQFIAANNTLEKMEANAEEAGYRLYPKDNLASSEHGIGGIRGTKDALRWAFDAKVGEVSGLYECGESDHMMVVGLAAVVPEGYRPLSMVKDQLRREVLRDKKAEKIMADMQAAGATSLEQYRNLSGAVSDSVKHVTFSASAYVPALRTSEPLVSAYADGTELNKLSAPVKGNGGVFVLQPYAKDKLNSSYNAEVEETSIATRYERMVGNMIINDLYDKGEVKDMRYLFF